MKNKVIFFVVFVLSGLTIRASYQEVGYIETAHKYIPVYCNSSDISNPVQIVEQRIGMISASTKSIFVELQNNGQIIVTTSNKGTTTLRD